VMRPEDLHDAGGKSRLPLPPGVRGSAWVSPCGRFRRELWRWTDNVPEPYAPRAEPYALWVGMNPSTATGGLDDATIRREWYRTVDLGLKSYCKANVLSYRTTDPAELVTAPFDDENFPTLERLARGACVVVLTIGVLPKPVRGFADLALERLRETGKPLHCLDITKGGWPKHSLYIRRDTPLRLFPRERTPCP
jgi:hypothetical protein